MKYIIDHDTVQKYLSDTREYDAKDKSYSPFFSSMGLNISTAENGVGALYLHYNRATRALWNKLIDFPLCINRAESSVHEIVFGSDSTLARLAFYNTDAFVFESDGLDSVALCRDKNERLGELWTSVKTEKTVIIDGYSLNGDGRDPDESVPVSVGIRVIKGRLMLDNDELAVAGDNGKIVFAFSVTALEVSDAKTKRILAAAPADAASAAGKCRAWMDDCLRDFSVCVKTEREARIVSTAVSGLLLNLTRGQGRLDGYVSSYPNRGSYPTHFLWDSCFQNLAYEKMNPRIAEDSMLLHAKNQRSDGKFEQFICSTWGRPHSSQSPLIGWATLRVARLTGNRAFMKTMLTAIEKNNDWWLTQRMTKYGLISCPDGLETGQDDSPRFDNGATLACDMNSYLLSQMRAAAALADMLSMKRKAAYWTKCAEAFAQRMCEVLYDEESNLFFDVLESSGEKIKIVSPVSFLPLWAGVPTDDNRARAAIEKYLLNPEYLFGDVPFPSIAYNQPCYDHEQWWRGPTWMPIAWLMLETLEKFGYSAEKAQAWERLYEVMVNDGMLHELFDSQTGEGMCSAEQGWTCAIFLNMAGDE